MTFFKNRSDKLVRVDIGTLGPASAWRVGLNDPSRSLPAIQFYDFSDYFKYSGWQIRNLENWEGPEGGVPIGPHHAIRSVLWEETLSQDSFISLG